MTVRYRALTAACIIIAACGTTLPKPERSFTPNHIDWTEGDAGAGDTGSSDSATPEASTPMGVHLSALCTDPTLRVTVTDDARNSLTVEAVRGAANPVGDAMPEFQATVPPNAIDIRVLDTNGIPLYERIGGDSWIDPSWGDRSHQFEPVNARARGRDFHRLARVAYELNNVRPGEGCADLQAATISDLVLVAKEPRIDPDPVPRGSAGTLLAVAPYRHKAHIQFKPAFWNFAGNPADHSAVKLNVYDANSSLIYIAVTSNHGTTANDPSMTTKCYANFTNRANQGSTMGNGCTTNYGFFGGQHVCNDDSYAEYGNIKYNSSSSWLTCGDGSLRVSAPTCW